MSFLSLIKEKNKRLEQIPAALQTALEKQQSKVFADIIQKLSKLSTIDGEIKISADNIRIINEINEDLKSSLLTDEYLRAARKFADEFRKQANINKKIIQAGMGEAEETPAARSYINTAKKAAMDSLTGSAIDTEFVKPVANLLEQAVVNGGTIAETITSIRAYVEGQKDKDSKLLKYVKQVTHDAFAVADRSYTSILSDYLDNEWFYYAGTEVEHTRCFCKERVGRYFHYKEIESWGDGQNLGECNLGGGTWAGRIPGTNSKTIYSYLGGYGCLHSLMPVSEVVVPASDMDRAKELGFIN